MKVGLSVVAVMALAVAGVGAGAQAFNFEDQAYGTFASITSTVGAQTVTVTSHGAAALDVTGPEGPASWANFSLIPYFQGGDGLVFDLSSAASSASIQFGDFGADDDPVTFTAYSGADGTGSVIDTQSVLYSGAQNIIAGDSAVGSLTVNGAGIQSLVVSSGGAFPGSLFFDNLSVKGGTAVPELGSAAVFGTLFVPAIGMLAWRRNRRK